MSNMLLASTTSISLQTAGKAMNMGDTISRGASYQDLYHGTYRINMVSDPVRRT
jgi:hypothetical protein